MGKKLNITQDQGIIFVLKWIFTNAKFFQIFRVLQELKGFVNKNKQRPEPAEAPTLSSPQEFQDAIQSSALTFIIFGEDSCTDCPKYESKFDDLATLYSEQENVNVFKVDCTPDDMKSLCESQKVLQRKRVLHS